MYVYQWRAGAVRPLRRGLLRPDGSERPSYAAFAAGVRALPEAGRLARRDLARVVVARAAVLRGTCAARPAGARSPSACAARARRATLRTIKTVGTRRYTTATLRLKVSAKVRRTLRRAARRRVALTVRSTAPVARPPARRAQAPEAVTSAIPSVSLSSAAT